MTAMNLCGPCGFHHPNDYNCDLSRERERLSRLLLEADRAAILAKREGYRVGYRAGFPDGREAEMRALIRAGRRVLDFPGHLAPAFADPSLAELEVLRWGPGGREHFGDPRPSDRYPAPKEVAA